MVQFLTFSLVLAHNANTGIMYTNCVDVLNVKMRQKISGKFSFVCFHAQEFAIV